MTTAVKRDLCKLPPVSSPPFFITSAVASAQTVVLRDTIEALPPISICQDGATHQTVVTKQRLWPARGTSLAGYVGKPVHIEGTPGQVTCKFLNVTKINVIPAYQYSVASTTSTTVKVDFYGVGAIGDVYYLYVGGLASNAITLPGITGPIHLDPAAFLRLAVFPPLGAGKPYLSLSAPRTPATLNVDFHTQAVVVHSKGTAEMTNVDKFRFK